MIPYNLEEINMILASEILELLKERHPDMIRLQETTQFIHGKDAGIQEIIREIETEIKNAGATTKS